MRSSAWEMLFIIQAFCTDAVPGEGAMKNSTGECDNPLVQSLLTRGLWAHGAGSCPGSTGAQRRPVLWQVQVTYGRWGHPSGIKLPIFPYTGIITNARKRGEKTHPPERAFIPVAKFCNYILNEKKKKKVKISATLFWQNTFFRFQHYF